MQPPRRLLDAGIEPAKPLIGRRRPQGAIQQLLGTETVPSDHLLVQRSAVRCVPFLHTRLPAIRLRSSPLQWAMAVKRFANGLRRLTFRGGGKRAGRGRSKKW